MAEAAEARGTGQEEGSPYLFLILPAWPAGVRDPRPLGSLERSEGRVPERGWGRAAKTGSLPGRLGP